MDAAYRYGRTSGLFSRLKEKNLPERHDLEAAVQKALFVDFGQRPPFRLDEVVVIGNIRIVHISPEADGA